MVSIQGQIQKVKRGEGVAPKFWKEGARKQHLNVPFSDFLVNLL